MNKERDRIRKGSIDSRELRNQMLEEDPELRELWDRTAFARAVANEVLKYRIEHGLSQSALARRLSVSQPLIARLEIGEHEPKISTLQRLSTVLGISFTVKIHPAVGADGDQPAPALVDVTIQAA